jgi:hypothetical protein
MRTLVYTCRAAGKLIVSWCVGDPLDWSIKLGVSAVIASVVSHSKGENRGQTKINIAPGIFDH